MKFKTKPREEFVIRRVLNERLKKLVRFGILERQAYAEVPPRVEYRLSPFGRKFARLIRDIEALQRDLDET